MNWIKTEISNDFAELAGDQATRNVLVSQSTRIVNFCSECILEN